VTFQMKIGRGFGKFFFCIKSVIGFMTLIHYYNVRILGFVNTIIKQASFILDLCCNKNEGSEKNNWKNGVCNETQRHPVCI
jgi:hypothetical protein